MKRHALIKHSGEVDKKFHCRICGRRYAIKQSLRYHLESKHNLRLEGDEDELQKINEQDECTRVWVVFADDASFFSGDPWAFWRIFLHLFTFLCETLLQLYHFSTYHQFDWIGRGPRRVTAIWGRRVGNWVLPELDTRLPEHFSSYGCYNNDNIDHISNYIFNSPSWSPFR